MNQVTDVDVLVIGAGELHHAVLFIPSANFITH